MACPTSIWQRTQAAQVPPTLTPFQLDVLHVCVRIRHSVGFFYKKNFLRPNKLPSLGLANMLRAFLTHLRNFMKPPEIVLLWQSKQEEMVFFSFFGWIFENFWTFENIQKWRSDTVMKMAGLSFIREKSIWRFKPQRERSMFVAALFFAGWQWHHIYWAPTLSTSRKDIFKYQRDFEQICLLHWHSHVVDTILFSSG